jgi:hypothetical protein
MKKNKLITFVLLIIFLASPVNVFARTFAGETSPRPVTEVQVSDNRVLFLLDDLRRGDRTLIGPFDAATYLFSLPPGWKISPGSIFELQYDLLVTGADANLLGVENRIVGVNLVVRFNNIVIGNISGAGTGSYVQQFQIPNDALVSSREDGRHILSLAIDSQLGCFYDLNATVTVRATSFFDLTIEESSPYLDFSLLPAPFFLFNSIIPDSVLMVVPDAPDPMELQSAMNIAAGLGAMIGGGYDFQFVNYGDLTDQQLLQNHLIFVGLPDQFDMLSNVEFDIPVRNGQLDGLPPESGDDGVLQMALSPWNPLKALLFVSGNSLDSLSKAAVAFSTGRVLSYQSPTLSFISDVQTLSSDIPVLEQFTLEDLGYTPETVSGIGSSAVAYQFSVSKSQVATKDGYIDLIYYHSGLMDNTNGSSFSVYLNEQIILSQVFAEDSEQVTTLRIRIPPGILRYGANLLEIAPTMLVLPSCDQAVFLDPWFTISNQTLFSLPISDAQAPGILFPDLKFFPDLFTINSNLGDVAFVVPHSDSAAWSVAAQISYFFGQTTQLDISNLQVHYGDSVPDDTRQGQSLIVIGVASENSFISEINDQLPAPFDFSTNTASERQLQISYRIPPGQNVGYLELLASPFNTENSLLIISGNTREGVGIAGEVLLGEELRDQLAGVFAVTNGVQISTGNANSLFSIVGEGVPGAEPVVTEPASNGAGPVVLVPPAWLMPFIIASLVIIAGIVIYIILSAVQKNRLRLRRESQFSETDEDTDES